MEDKQMEKMDKKTAELWDFLLQGVATQSELELVTTLNGCSEDVLNDILYVRTGYRDKEQYLASMS